jgi:hypothetical protein
MGKTINLYIVPVVSGIFDYALLESVQDDREFYLDFLNDRDNELFSAILSSNDGQHYKIDGVILSSDVYSYIGEYVADNAAIDTTVFIDGGGASIIKRYIHNRRAGCKVRIRKTRPQSLPHIIYVEA